MALVDSHCHINFPELADRIPDLVSAAHNVGVEHMLCVSVDMEHFPDILTLARQHANIYASVGKHPNEQAGVEPDVDMLVALADDPDVVAIGETGLDYFRSDGDLNWQRQRFITHIEAAKRTGKPIIVHSRDADDDMIRILTEEDAGACGVVMHCFASDWKMAKACLDIGCYISFSGIVTFKNADALREVALNTPLDRILVETDCPYLAPVPKRGKVNEPAFVRHTADFIADLRKESTESFEAATTNNFFTLFDIRHGQSALDK